MSLVPLPRAPVRPVRVEAFVLRCPIATPVRTSFGTMHDRPAVFVGVVDEDGHEGWGEIWCNFPSCGAEHRARLLDTVLAPLLTSRGFESPQEAFHWLEARTAVLALQSGEPGPIAQVIAGIDLAMWDLCARRAGEPLWRLLGGRHDEVTAYASGINPDDPCRMVEAKAAEGFRAFKLKIGFGAERDLANLRAVRALLGREVPLMVDANQGWTVEEALQIAPQLQEFALDWLEEPLRADRPPAEWQRLAAAVDIPLAAGENLLGHEAFDAAMASHELSILQPDLAKWGGISGCWPVIAKALQNGLRYCPHFLGAGVGLRASAHVLAATGGNGILEIDSNPNPLRSELAGPLGALKDGRCRLSDAPGIGITPDLPSLVVLAARGC